VSYMHALDPSGEFSRIAWQIMHYQSNVEFRTGDEVAPFRRDGMAHSDLIHASNDRQTAAVFAAHYLRTRHTRKRSIDDLYEPVIWNTRRTTSGALLSSGAQSPAIGVSLVTSMRRHPPAN